MVASERRRGARKILEGDVLRFQAAEADGGGTGGRAGEASLFLPSLPQHIYSLLIIYMFPDPVEFQGITNDSTTGAKRD